MSKQEKTGSLAPLLKYVRPHSGLLIVSLLLAAVSVAATLYAPILVGDAVDLIITKGNVDFSGAAKILVKLGTVVLISAVSQWIMMLLTNRVSYLTVRDLRSDAFANLQKLPLSYIDKCKHGDMISRLVADIEKKLPKMADIIKKYV